MTRWLAALAVILIGVAHRILPDDLTIVLLAEGEHVVAIEGAALSPADLEALVEVSVLLLD